MKANGPILLTGATGYIGGRLLHPLLATGRPLRLLARDPERLRPVLQAGPLSSGAVPEVEVVQGDAFDRESLSGALSGVDTAYYLVHSLQADTGDLFERELRAARNFADSVRAAGVRRLI